MPMPIRRRPAQREPMTPEAREAAAAWIATRIAPASGRLSVQLAARQWRAHAADMAIKPGQTRELLAMIRAAHPQATKRPARSGKEVHTGSHLVGLALR